MTESTDRRWEITGGDAMGYDGKEFTSLNMAYEEFEFLQETHPDLPWEIKEKN